jgi:hypothetical protein
MEYHQLKWQDLPEQLRMLTPDEKTLFEAICLWSVTYEKPVEQVLNALNHIRAGLTLLQLQLEQEQEPSYVAERLLQEIANS